MTGSSCEATAVAHINLFCNVCRRQGSDMDADDDEFMTANNDGYGLEDDDILTRWEEMLPPGTNFMYRYITVSLSVQCT